VGGIAADKAHIVKRGGRVFVMPQSGPARRAIEARARQVGAPLVWTREAVSARIEEAAPEGLVLALGGEADYGAVRTGLFGAHQADNVGAAVAVAETILDPERLRPAVRHGLRGARVPGRMELRRRGATLVMLDGGHNPAAARAVARALDRHFPGRRVAGILGMARDKAHGAALRALAPALDTAVVTRSGNPRAALPEVLRAAYPGRAVCAPALPEALALAEKARPDLILVWGSFILAGEARTALGLRPA
jgi:dihydrofolate synthase/folylpolyglutamate synthase